MLPRLLAYGKFGNLYCGVEHAFIDGNEKINTLLLKKSKNEFLIENNYECDTITELSDQLQKEQHLFLILNNEKVLFKIIDGIFDAQKAITSAFPNLKIEAFYYEVLHSKTHTFVAICRKDYVDSLLKEYYNSNLNIVGFSFGNLISSQLHSYVTNSSMHSSNAIISFGDDELSNIEKSGIDLHDSYNINGLEIANTSILPFAGILSYYTHRKTTNSNFKSLNKELTNNFIQKRIFDIGLKASLSFIFILLLISFLFFSHYTSNIDLLNAELEINKSFKKSFTELTDEVDKKEGLVTNFSLTSSKASWYMDQIGISIPTTILLSEIRYQPLEKNSNPDSYPEGKEIVIQEHSIIVKGNSGNSKDFSIWISELEQQKWIEKVMIQEYGTGKKTTTEFELIIEIKK